jgi:hypothetical protein
MSDFYALSHAAEQDPSHADFTALRQAYVESKQWRSIKHITQQKLMQITNAAKGFEEVRDTCLNILKANPVDLEARMMLAVALEKLGDAEAAEKAHLFAEKMLDAILATGSGKSFESAIVLVSEMEAWTVMRSFGIKAKSHERHQHDGKIFDVYQGSMGDREVTIYFDVTDFVRFLDEALETNIPPE